MKRVAGTGFGDRLKPIAVGSQKGAELFQGAFSVDFDDSLPDTKAESIFIAIDRKGKRYSGGTWTKGWGRAAFTPKLGTKLNIHEIVTVSLFTRPVQILTFKNVAMRH
jgi:hypothetical protein